MKTRNTSHRVRAEQARQRKETNLIDRIDQKAAKQASKKTSHESKQSNSPDALAKPDPYQRMLRKLDADIAERQKHRPA